MPYKKLFPAQEESEKIFLLIRKHWFAYVIFWFVGIFMSIPAIGVLVFLFYNPDLPALIGKINILVEIVYSLSVLALLLYGFVDYYLDIYIVTDRRIVDIEQNGFFHRQISELYLREVQDVKAKVYGFFPTMLHFGQVIIQTAGKIENFTFDSIPHPYAVSKMIMDLHEGNVGRSSRQKRLTTINDPKDNEVLELRGYSVDNKDINQEQKINGEEKIKPEEFIEKHKEEEVKELLNSAKNKIINLDKSDEVIKIEGTLEEGKQINIK